MRNSQLWGSQASIGSCDWTIAYANDADDNLVITLNVIKLGTAWATWCVPAVCAVARCDCVHVMECGF